MRAAAGGGGVMQMLFASVKEGFTKMQVEDLARRWQGALPCQRFWWWCAWVRGAVPVRVCSLLVNGVLVRA
jgi:hypothetical protein